MSGPPATALVKLVKINALTRMKMVGVLPTLVGGLMAMHPDVVSQFAAILRTLDDAADSAIEQLAEEYLTREPQGFAEQLLEKMTGRYRKRWQRCFELLGKVGPAAEPAVPVLREFLKSADPWLVQQAKGCLIRIRRTAEE